jgi:hypothetical protein
MNEGRGRWLQYNGERKVGGRQAQKLGRLGRFGTASRTIQ